jgi:hypothetical protein
MWGASVDASQYPAGKWALGALIGFSVGYCAGTKAAAESSSQQQQEEEKETEEEVEVRAQPLCSDGPTAARLEWLKQLRRCHRKQRRCPLGPPVPMSEDDGEASSQHRIAGTVAYPREGRSPDGSTLARVQRQVVHGDALSWLDSVDVIPGHVVTSLPDICELQHVDTVPQYRAWFEGTVALILSKLAPRAVLVLYQSDGRHGGLWLDKSHIAQRAAESCGARLLWHKICVWHTDLGVYRALAARGHNGRPKYTHLLAFSKELRGSDEAVLASATPDVVARGSMPWARAMGADACVVACLLVRALAERDPCSAGAPSQQKLVLDPFCGQGTVLAVANELGLDSLGIELSAKRCRSALMQRVLSLEQ